MKLGIVGAGSVGAACIMALSLRSFTRELVIIDKNTARANAIATDLQYGIPHTNTVNIYAGDYSHLENAHLVLITAGVNEKTGGATDRNDPKGRLKLLSTNAEIYREIVPQIMQVAPHAIILVVTDPPDPLADLTKKLAGHDRVLSTGTFLDSMRFRVHLAKYFHVNPNAVSAYVLGEHGTSQVYLWSSASIGGELVTNMVSANNLTELKNQVEQAVRYANITIIEGNNASQYGIGLTCARIAEIIARNEQTVIPIGSFHPQYNVTLSVPSVVGYEGVTKRLQPQISEQELEALQNSAEVLLQAKKSVGC